MSQIKYMQVDVFSKRPFMGNPVAVFFEADILTQDQMQKITNWMDLSECTFICKPTNSQADYKLRIFDPAHEMPFAGHPTLGSAHALLSTGYKSKNKGYLVQECQIGLVKIHYELDGDLFFELPTPKISQLSKDQQYSVLRALGVAENNVQSIDLVDVGPQWITVKTKTAEQVINLKPDMEQLSKCSENISVEGVTVFGEFDRGDIKFEVRSFAPLLGVPEDPVCGSGNGSVAAIVKRDGNLLGESYLASQGRARGRDGLISVKFIDDKILIGGKAITCLEGAVKNLT